MTDPSTPVPSDEAVEHACAAWDERLDHRRQAEATLTAAYAIDAPRLRAEAAAEARADYDDFIEGLTAKLNAAGVPAMPSWPDAIDWLIERAQSAQAEARAATLRAVEAHLLTPEHTDMAGAARLREALERTREALNDYFHKTGSAGEIDRAYAIVSEALAAVPEAPEPVYEYRVRIEYDTGTYRGQPSDEPEAQRFLAQLSKDIRERWPMFLERRPAPGPWERVEELEARIARADEALDQPYCTCEFCERTVETRILRGEDER